jgi:hypothetical protein
MMQFDLSWIDAPDAGDTLERHTWAQLVLRAGALTPTRVYDRAAQSEREAIFIPAYPLARWIVDQWWSLLYEPWPFGERLPEPGATTSVQARSWLERHCLRVATPGFASPFVCIFGQGRTVGLTSRPDPRNRYVHTPVEFRESADISGDREALRLELARFVACVLDRITSVEDERAKALCADWQAICDASAQEAEFCRAAGRLGLDPYAADGWPHGVLEWFERSPEGELERKFTTDLLEAPDPPASKPSHHGQLARLVNELKLTAGPPRFGTTAESQPFEDGYALANLLRAQLKLDDIDPLGDLREASEVASGRAMVVTETPGVPEGRVLALVGWRANQVPVVATRRSGRPSTARFLGARALYLALRGTADGPRLVTDARTWDQRASRAFGAELLAPRAGVKKLLAEHEARFGREDAEVYVAEHYGVSPMALRHQDDNFSGIAA